MVRCDIDLGNVPPLSGGQIAELAAPRAGQRLPIPYQRHPTTRNAASAETLNEQKFFGSFFQKRTVLLF
jgi:hypothetical protein